MKYKLLTHLFILIGLFTVLCSHEFWLQPDKYIYKRGEDVNIRFLVGEDFQGENWEGDSSRIKNLTYYFGGAKDDNLVTLFPKKGDSLKVKQYDEGTAMVTYNSRNSFIELDSAEFNKYLADEGLIDALEYRVQNNEMDSTGYEFYQRSVKTIFQVGGIKDETYKQNTTLPLDIIPLTHPYKINDSGTVAALILFQDQPLINTKVKIWHHHKGKTDMKELNTDEKGIINVPVITKGQWMISCVRMQRIDKDPKAQWQSYWGSCTWGYY